MRSTSPLLKALTLVLPAGAFGASVILALSSAQARAQPDESAAPPPVSPAGVSEQLRRIRTAVAQLSAAGSAQPGGEGPPPAQSNAWGNGPNWGNGPGWSNGAAWGNGPNWSNAGWPNWGNGWHNWGNGWHNGWRWHNWHNFWHNW